MHIFTACFLFVKATKLAVNYTMQYLIKCTPITVADEFNYDRNKQPMSEILIRRVHQNFISQLWFLYRLESASISPGFKKE